MLTGGVGIGFIWDAYNSSRLSEIILALIYVGSRPCLTGWSAS